MQDQGNGVGRQRVVGHERDLHDLVKTGGVEEAWAYVKYSDGKEFWHEMGINETERTAIRNIEGRRFFGDKDTIESVSFYHFHPEGDTEGKRNFVDTETISYMDVRGDMENIAWLRAMYPELLDKTDFRTVVDSGVYTMKFNARALEDETIWSEGVDKARQLDEERGFYAWNDAGLDYGIWNKGKFAHQNKNFAKRYSNKSFQITFEEKKSPGAEYIAQSDARRLKSKSKQVAQSLKRLSRELQSMKKSHARQRL